MIPTVTILESGPTAASLLANDVRDLAHVRRLLLQAALSVEREGIAEHFMPRVKLELLRSFLTTINVTDHGSARRLLLMALLQLEDEDDAQRFVMPHPVLPIISPRN